MITEWTNRSKTLDAFVLKKFENIPTSCFVSEEIEFVFHLIDKNQNQRFHDLIIEKNKSFLKYARSNHVEVNELSKFLTYNVQFVHKLSPSSNSAYLWSQLFDLIRFSLLTRKSSAVTTKNQSDLEELCKAIIEKLFKENLENIGVCDKISECLVNERDVRSIITEFIKLVEESISKWRITEDSRDWIMKFLVDIINNSCSISALKKIFEDILFEKNNGKYFISLII